MCGIVGYVSSKELDGRRMVRSLSHRGPDDSGEYSWDRGGRRIFIGHRRLSIVDLSKLGHQPMRSADGQIVLIFNGEIYNHPELRARYLPERMFASTCDTEVLLGLYEKYGASCLQFLNGDFAFAVLDKRRNRLFIARDRIGVKPLYYYDGGGTFAISSEIKAFAAAGLSLELDDSQLQNFFVFKYSPGDNTLFRNVRRLSPGCFLEYDLDACAFRVERYWALKKNSMYGGLDSEEQKDILVGLLQDSAKIRLMSDVPVGLFLSGGIDSSAIAYFIKDHSDIVHYTARKSTADLKKEGSSSDFFFANRLANDWRLNLVPIDIGGAETNTDLVRQVIRHSDDLIADGSLIPSFLITQEASRVSRVMLSGMGGDELFLGYAGHQISLLASLLDRLPKPVSKGFSHITAMISQGRGWFRPYRRYLHKLGKYYLRSTSERYGAYNIVGDLDNALSVFRDDRRKPLDIFAEYFDRDDDLFTAINRFEFDNFLVKNLHYLDHMTMAHSIEGRVPFLDHRIVEYAFSLPRKVKLSRFGRSKVILKDAMRQFLPAYIIQRRKAGFGMPFRSILCTREKIEELLDKRFFCQFPGFDMSGIETIIDKHLNGVEDTSNLIYALVSFQEWHKLFIQGEALQ